MTSTRLAAETLRWLPRKGISRAFGRVASLEPPRGLLARAIDLYVSAYRVDLEECELPADGFRSFNEFFSRPLKPGARPLDPDADVVLCPADGKLEDEGPIAPDATLTIKGSPYTVTELVGDAAEAERLAGGRFAVVYLSPRDYHRVHAPVSGGVVEAHHLGGTLYPVNRIGVDHVPQLFAKNERVAVRQESPVHGGVVTVLVGALVVGGIRVTFDDSIRSNDGQARGRVRYPAPRPLERGDELGRFLLGSTAIVLVPAPPPDRHGGESYRCEVPTGSPVRMGRALYRRVRTA